jgi:hypothetical protein
MAHLPVLRSLAAVVDVVRAHDTLYLRYSEGPEEEDSQRRVEP